MVKTVTKSESLCWERLWVRECEGYYKEVVMSQITAQQVLQQSVMGKVVTAKKRQRERRGVRQSEGQFEEGVMAKTTGRETTQEVMVKAVRKEETL